MNGKKALVLGTLVVGLLAPLAALGQVVTPDPTKPVQVLKLKGDFAKKLDGAVMPSGKGWKAVTDKEKQLQIMVPSGWKVDPTAEGDTILRLVPPGDEKKPKAVLEVNFTAPRDADLLEVDEELALSLADDLTETARQAQAQFTPLDSGYMLARGMKFALAGGTMVFVKQNTELKKKTFRREVLLFIAEDRVVNLIFTTLEEDWKTYADDVARIFASYQTLAQKKTDDTID